jgi:hypothetical protein
MIWRGIIRRRARTGTGDMCGRRLRGWAAACSAADLRDWSRILGGDEVELEEMVAGADLADGDFLF